jgi:hypothetical protein
VKFLFLATLLSFQVTDGDDLSPNTKPVIPLAPFQRLSCVSVNEYKPHSKSNPEQLLYIRVFRYTGPGDMETESKNLEKVLTKKDGWIVDRKASTKTMFVIERLLKHPQVRRQAVMLFPGSIYRNPLAPEQTGLKRLAGWIRVSFNEEYVSKPPPAKVIRPGKG